MDIFLEANAMIWPRLSYLCQFRSTDNDFIIFKVAGAVLVVPLSIGTNKTVKTRIWSWLEVFPFCSFEVFPFCSAADKVPSLKDGPASERTPVGGRTIHTVEFDSFVASRFRRLRDQICTTEGPKVNRMMQVDF